MIRMPSSQRQSIGADHRFGVRQQRFHVVVDVEVPTRQHITVTSPHRVIQVEF